MGREPMQDVDEYALSESFGLDRIVHARRSISVVGLADDRRRRVHIVDLLLCVPSPLVDVAVTT
jgi:hypothetical protein